MFYVRYGKGILLASLVATAILSSWPTCSAEPDMVVMYEVTTTEPGNVAFRYDVPGSLQAVEIAMIRDLTSKRMLSMEVRFGSGGSIAMPDLISCLPEPKLELVGFLFTADPDPNEQWSEIVVPYGKPDVVPDPAPNDSEAVAQVHLYPMLRVTIIRKKVARIFLSRSSHESRMLVPGTKGECPAQDIAWSLEH